MIKFEFVHLPHEPAATDKQISCANKQAYGHEETAKKACESMKIKKNLDLEPYLCRHCNQWHIGHPKFTKPGRW